MSLIDDALKRAREEAARRESGSAASRWAPSHIPGRRRSSGGVVALLVLVFAAGVVAARLLLVRPSAPPPAGATRPTAVSRPAAATPPPSRESAPVSAEAAPPRPAAEKPARPARRPPEPQATARTASEPPPAPSAAVAEPARPAPGRKTFVHEAEIGGEKIELDGIVFSDTNPVALINGKIVAPGGSVGAYTLDRVRPEQVDLSGNGVSFSILLH